MLVCILRNGNIGSYNCDCLVGYSLAGLRAFTVGPDTLLDDEIPVIKLSISRLLHILARPVRWLSQELASAVATTALTKCRSLPSPNTRIRTYIFKLK